MICLAHRTFLNDDSGHGQTLCARHSTRLARCSVVPAVLLPPRRGPIFARRTAETRLHVCAEIIIAGAESRDFASGTSRLRTAGFILKQRIVENLEIPFVIAERGSLHPSRHRDIPSAAAVGGVDTSKHQSAPDVSYASPPM